MREGRQQIRLYDVRIVGAAAVDALASAHCSQASPQAARAVDATSVPQTAIETNRVHLLDYVVVWIAVARMSSATTWNGRFPPYREVSSE